jgi:hypothetical protein
VKRAVSVSSGLPRVGEWTIETGPPEDGSPADHLRAFRTAFADLARPESATADLMWIDPDGHVTRVEEAVPVSLDSAGDLVLPPDVSLVTSVILHCALGVHTGTEVAWQSGGLQFSYSCVVEYDDEDRVQPVESAVTVSIFVDCWNDAGNRARLANALQEWERRTGKPIAEWSSGVHRGQVDRYGFADPA